MKPDIKVFWILVGLALTYRAVVLLAIGPDASFALTPDSASYIKPAQQMRATGNFATPDKAGHLVPELYRTPGYPVFLIPFLDEDGVDHRSVQWAQALLNSLAAGLVYLAAFYYWRNFQAALLAGTGFALDFVNAIHCAFVLTDILFVFLITVCLYALVKRRYAWAGLAACAAAFVRPVGLYYPVALLLFMGIQRLSTRWGPTWKQTAVFLVISCLPLIGWMARNDHAAGRFTFTTIQEANIHVVRAALVVMEREHVSYETAVEKVQTAYASSGTDESSGQWAARYLLMHWREYGTLMLKDVVKLFTGNSMKIAAWAILKDDHYSPAAVPVHSTQSPVDQARDLGASHPALGVGLIVYLIFLGLVYGLSLLGFLRSVQENGWAETLVIFSSVLYFTAVTLGVDAQARYRLPLMPALFLFAGGGYKMLFTKERP